MLTLVFVFGCTGSPLDEGEPTAVDVGAIVGGVKTTDYPSAALLNMRAAAGGGYACTATVIAPRVVLTAGHCVDDMVSFRVLAAGVERDSTEAETYDWDENGAETVNPLHHDIGLVYLREPIELVTYPALADARVPEGTAAVDVGRIREGVVTNEFFAAPIVLRSGLRVGYPFDYSAAGIIEHGDSGGPVFLAGTQTVVAVNSGIGAETQVLARVDLVLPWILGRIAAHGGRPDAVAPPPDAGSEESVLPAEAPCVSAESEPNDDVLRAGALKAMSCGRLEGADVDWFWLPIAAGEALITLEPSGDAVAMFGFLREGRCVPAVRDVRSAMAAVPSGTTIVCMEVTSPAHEAQSYRVSVRY